MLALCYLSFDFSCLVATTSGELLDASEQNVCHRFARFATPCQDLQSLGLGISQPCIHKLIRATATGQLNKVMLLLQCTAT